MNSPFGRLAFFLLVAFITYKMADFVYYLGYMDGRQATEEEGESL